jgi:hypothetical protein
MLLFLRNSGKASAREPDALAADGFEDAEPLGHLRSPGPDFRGCRHWMRYSAGAEVPFTASALSGY